MEFLGSLLVWDRVEIFGTLKIKNRVAKFQLNMLWKRLRVLGSVAHYHPKCQSGTSAPHLDSVCIPVGKICIIRIVFQSLKVIAKGFYMGEHLSSNWNCQSIYLLHVKYLQKCSLLCKHNFSVDPQIFSPINTCSELTLPFPLLFWIRKWKCKH